MHLSETLKNATSDVKLLWGSVFIRMTSYGVTNQVLTLYLKSLNINESKIGLFMTLTLVGDTLMSYWLTWYSDQIGRRNVMLLGALLMVISGIVFAMPQDSHFIVLLIAAICGVISPSGDETGPFKSVEEASIAHLTPLYHRAEVYAVHGMMGTFGSAIGSMAGGVLVDYLHKIRGWEMISCYRFAFVTYSILAAIKFVMMLFLSNKCEVSSPAPIDVDSDTSPMLEPNEDEDDQYLYTMNGLDHTLDESLESQILWSGLSRRSHTILLRLLVIFMIDSFGYGFMTSAWVVYYFKLTFGLAAATIGTLFFFTNISNALSSIPSAYLAKTFGPVAATLMTQTPSGLFFILVPVLNFNVVLSSLALLFNSILLTMDVVPRQILLTTLIKHDELTKVLGIVNIGKTLARCVGPIFTGKFAESGMLWICYVISGCSVFISGGLLALNFKGVDNFILEKQNIETSFN